MANCDLPESNRVKNWGNWGLIAFSQVSKASPEMRFHPRRGSKMDRFALSRPIARSMARLKTRPGGSTRRFYPETVTEDASSAPAEPVYREKLSLF
jgi:hypothetical protein